jgi:hypothetical protein
MFDDVQSVSFVNGVRTPAALSGPPRRTLVINPDTAIAVMIERTQAEMAELQPVVVAPAEPIQAPVAEVPATPVATSGAISLPPVAEPASVQVHSTDSVGSSERA